MILVRTLAVLALGLAPALTYAQGTAAPLSVAKLTIKLSFSKAGADSLKLHALLPIPAGFVVAGRMIGADVGGVARTFVLDEKGNGVSDGAKVKLSVKATKGVVAAQSAKFALKIAKGTFSRELTDEGLVNATVDVPVEVQTTVSVDTEPYTKLQPLAYKAKAGKTGSASGK